MAFCSNCGSRIEDGAKFCPECGTPAAAAQAAEEIRAEAQQIQQEAAQAAEEIKAEAAQAAEAQQGAAQSFEEKLEQAKAEASDTVNKAQQAASGAAGAAAAAFSTAEEGGFDPADIEKNKVMAGLAYLLFFLPLITDSNSKFGRFHANQGLLLLILFVANSIITPILAVVLIGLLTGPVIYIFGIVIGIMGMVNAFNGKAKRLPIIGRFDLIK